MFKPLAWLLAAALLVTAAPGHAKPLPAGRETPPKSMDRMLAPNDYPTNVVKILRTNNKAQTNTYVPLVFTFRNVNPFSVIRFLRRPVRLEEGDLFTFVTPEGNGGRVLFIVPDYMAKSLAELVRRLDVPGQTTDDRDLRIYRQLKHRRASETDPDFISAISAFSTAPALTSDPLSTALLMTDPETNALYFQDAPTGAQALDAALTDWFDVPTAEVQLEVKLYELNATNNGTLGLDYTAWKNTLGQSLFAGGGYGERASIGDVGPLEQNVGLNEVPHRSMNASGYNYAFNYDVSSEFFDFLVTKGKAKILNEAKLAALNTHHASLTSSDQVLYYSVQTAPTNGVRQGVNPSNDIITDTNSSPFDKNGSRVMVPTTNILNSDGSLTPVEVGFRLDVTPTIGEQSIQLHLNIDWSDYNGFAGQTVSSSSSSSSDSSSSSEVIGGFPLINTRHLSTTIRTGLGDEIVIGGLNRQVRTKATNKVPILGSIPILGYAFGGETQLNQNTEVVAAIKPVAISSYDIAKDYQVTSSEQSTIDQAKGEKDIKGPKTSWGFDQYGIDPSKDQPLLNEDGKVAK